MDLFNVLFGLVLLAAAISIYFLPTIVAFHREHENGVPIAILNLFLGWSLVGWVVALVWSTMGQKPSRPPIRAMNDPRYAKPTWDYQEPKPDEIPDEWLQDVKTPARKR